jgi:membrane protein implicated in regulation of membrane protease activity
LLIGLIAPLFLFFVFAPLLAVLVMSVSRFMTRQEAKDSHAPAGDQRKGSTTGTSRLG